MIRRMYEPKIVALSFSNDVGRGSNEHCVDGASLIMVRRSSRLIGLKSNILEASVSVKTGSSAKRCGRFSYIEAIRGNVVVLVDKFINIADGFTAEDVLTQR